MFLRHFFDLSNFQNIYIFEGEILLKTKPTTFNQISCEIMCYSKVTLISIIDPDATGVGAISKNEWPGSWEWGHTL